MVYLCHPGIRPRNLGSAADEDEGVEGTEIKETDIKDVSSDGRETWTNERRNPIRLPIICRVPQRVVIIMRSIERLMSNSNMASLEFGLFLTGKFDAGGELVIGEEFYVPSQKVSGASIDFNEEPPDAKFNGVIHRHPDGCKSFSGTDANHINKNFDFSLLYVCNDITMGVFNLDVNGVRIQLPLQIEVMYPVFDMTNENIIDKIQRKSMESSSTGLLPPGFARDGVEGFLIDPNDDDDDDNEENDDSADDKMYRCKTCGNDQFITLFPEECEECGTMLYEQNTELINDLSEVTPDDIVRPSLSDDESDAGIWRPGCQ